jgi:hypothetical protein
VLRLPLFAGRVLWLCHHRVKAALRYAPALLGLDPAAPEPESRLGMAKGGADLAPGVRVHVWPRRPVLAASPACRPVLPPGPCTSHPQPAARSCHPVPTTSHLQPAARPWQPIPATSHPQPAARFCHPNPATCHPQLAARTWHPIPATSLPQPGSWQPRFPQPATRSLGPGTRFPQPATHSRAGSRRRIAGDGSQAEARETLGGRERIEAA